MLSAHFERKLTKSVPRLPYTLEDAKEDAILIMEHTEDKYHQNGSSIALGSNDLRLRSALREYHESLHDINLGFEFSADTRSQVIPYHGMIEKDANLSLLNTLPREIKLLSLHRNAEGDDVFRQTSKDLERDRLLINGQYIVGAEKGIPSIQGILRASIERTLLAHDSSIRDVSMETLLALTNMALAKASRTNSAGSAYLALQPLLAIDEHAIPLSELAPPICIRTTVGVLPTGNSASVPKLALICEIDCTTIYHIRNSGILDSENHLKSENNVDMVANTVTQSAGYCVRLQYQDFCYVELNYSYDTSQHATVLCFSQNVLEGTPRLRIEQYCSHE